MPGRVLGTYSLCHHLLVAVICVVFGSPAIRSLEYLFLARLCQAKYRWILVSFAAFWSIGVYAIFVSIADSSRVEGELLATALFVLVVCLYPFLLVVVSKAVVSRLADQRYAQLFAVFTISAAIELLFSGLLRWGPACSPRIFYAGTLMGMTCAMLPSPLWVGLCVSCQFLAGQTFTHRGIRRPLYGICLLIMGLGLVPSSVFDTTTLQLPEQMPSILIGQAYSLSIERDLTARIQGLEEVDLDDLHVGQVDLIILGEGSHKAISGCDLRDVRYPCGPAVLACGFVSAKRPQRIAGVEVMAGKWYVQSTLFDEHGIPTLVRRKQKLLPFFESLHASRIDEAPENMKFAEANRPPAYVSLGPKGAKAAIRICYEACYPGNSFPFAFSDHREIDFCIAQIGNQWLVNGSYLDLHFEKNLQLASILNGRWTIVAANSHSSMLISPRGTVVRQLANGRRLLKVHGRWNEVPLGDP